MRRPVRGRAAPIVAWLVAVWVALWGSPSWANLVAGSAVGVGLVTLFPAPEVARTGTVRPLAAARFAAYFAWKLVEASAVVAWEVVTPRNKINQGIVAVPIRGGSDTLVTLVANAISLTPGTLTLEVDDHPPVLYVHVLHLRGVEAVRREVQHLERLAILAFGSPEAVEAARSPKASTSARSLRRHRPGRRGTTWRTRSGGRAARIGGGDDPRH